MGRVTATLVPVPFVAVTLRVESAAVVGVPVRTPVVVLKLRPAGTLVAAQDVGLSEAENARGTISFPTVRSWRLVKVLMTGTGMRGVRYLI
jgi:hypothetical protein